MWIFRKNKTEGGKLELDNPNSIENINRRIASKSMDWIFMMIYLMILVLFISLESVHLVFKIVLGATYVFITIFVISLHLNSVDEKNNIKQYIDLIIIKNEKDINHIASVMKCDYDSAENTIMKIISKGYIVGHTIDKNMRCVVNNNPE